MNWIDYLLIALIAFSCVAGVLRGLLREVIALVTWVAAVWIAWHYAYVLEPHLGGALASESVRAWAARTIIFLGIVLIGTGIGALVSHLVRLSIFSGTDRFFGGVFGFLRGLVIIGLFVMLCHALRLNGEPWWRGSTLIPYGERAANVLRGMVGERKIPIEPPGTSSGPRI
ncbi:MAG TPA: CvpA family protein [Steroidobacteraceae bacterium]|jgi:membrane protein required for colicin V production|nr:CvpA family protein [Steroidobacteraceae bacterium]